MRTVCITISLLLLGYIIARVLIVPITIDEGWTFKEFVMETSVWNVVTMAHPAANNHILNSLLTKFCTLFSLSELSVRMPNILAFLLYSYSAYKISRLLFQDRIMQLNLFLCLLLNIMLLSFFGLCRGYGIGIGLLLFSLYCLLQFMRQLPGTKKHYLHLCMLSAVLAVYASFAILPVCLFIFLIMAITLYRADKRKNIVASLHAVKFPAVYSLLLFLLCAHPISRLIGADELYYGGIDNFIIDTLGSMMLDIAGAGRITPVLPLIAGVTAGIVAVSLFVALWYGVQKKGVSIYYVVPFILFLAIAGMNAQFYLLHTKFVIHRTVLFLYPLIILSVFSALALLYARYKRSTIAFSSAMTIALLYFFIIQLNFDPPPDWWLDKYNKEVLAYINQNPLAVRKGEKTKIYVHYLCVNSFNYYIDTKYFKSIRRMQTEDPKNVRFDESGYYYIEPESNYRSLGLVPVLQHNDGLTLYRKN